MSSAASGAVTLRYRRSAAFPSSHSRVNASSSPSCAAVRVSPKPAPITAPSITAPRLARSDIAISGHTGSGSDPHAGRLRIEGGVGLAFLSVHTDPQPPEISLAGRVAMVTGGSGGIGRAIALALSSAGVSVAIAYGANDAPAHQLAGQITAAGGRAAALSADLAHPAEIARLVQEADESFGQVDVLVSNAGM